MIKIQRSNGYENSLITQWLVYNPITQLFDNNQIAYQLNISIPKTFL